MSKIDEVRKALEDCIGAFEKMLAGEGGEPLFSDLVKNGKAALDGVDEANYCGQEDVP